MDGRWMGTNSPLNSACFSRPLVLGSRFLSIVSPPALELFWEKSSGFFRVGWEGAANVWIIVLRIWRARRVSLWLVWCAGWRTTRGPLVMLCRTVWEIVGENSNERKSATQSPLEVLWRRTVQCGSPVRHSTPCHKAYSTFTPALFPVTKIIVSDWFSYHILTYSKHVCNKV